MAQQQKVGSQKKLQRAARMRAYNSKMHPIKVGRTRRRKLKKAEQSCGKAFADTLRQYYRVTPI